MTPNEERLRQALLTIMGLDDDTLAAINEMMRGVTLAAITNPEAAVAAMFALQALRDTHPDNNHG